MVDVELRRLRLVAVVRRKACLLSQSQEPVMSRLYRSETLDSSFLSHSILNGNGCAVGETVHTFWLGLIFCLRCFLFMHCHLSCIAPSGLSSIAREKKNIGHRMIIADTSFWSTDEELSNTQLLVSLSCVHGFLRCRSCLQVRSW